MVAVKSMDVRDNFKDWCNQVIMDELQNIKIIFQCWQQTKFILTSLKIVKCSLEN